MASLITEILSRYSSEYISGISDRVSTIEPLHPDFTKLDKRGLINYARRLEKDVQAFKTMHVAPFNVDIRGEFLHPYSSKVKERDKAINEIKDEEKRSIKEIQDKKNRKYKEALRVAEDYLQSLKDGVSDLVNRQKEIMSHKDRITEIMRLYNLNPSAYKIDEEVELSREEIEELYTLTEFAIDNIIKDKKIHDKLISLLYYPIEADVKPDVYKYLKYCHFIGLLAVAYLTKPYFFGVVAILFFIKFLGNLAKVKDREELLSLAYSMCQERDFFKGLEDDSDYIALLMKADNIKNTSIENELESIKEVAKLKIDKLMEGPENEDLNKAEIEYAQNLDYISSYFSEVTKQAEDMVDSTTEIYEKEYSDLISYMNQLKSKWSFLGDEIANRKTLTTEIRTGVYEIDGEVYFEETAELPLQNISFKYKTEAQKEELIDYIKLLMINLLSNIKEKLISVIIFDSKDIGRDFAEFQLKNPGGVFRFESEDINKIIKDEITPELKTIIARTGKTPVQEYNKASDAVGKLTTEYKLIIILSTEDEPDVAVNKEVKKLIDYSAEYGYFIWTLNRHPDTINSRELEKVKEFYKDIAVCEAPGVIQFENYVLDIPKEPAKPYEYKNELGMKFLETLETTIKANRMDILDYELGYRQKYIPDNKIWKGSTRKGIELRLGLIDGDPDKPGVVVLGDNNVHCLTAGATGSGKSATINEVLANLLYTYPPEELELVMIDFKNVEFAMYTDKNLIPHAKVIAGTKDGEYAISIFEYLMDEMARRTKLFEANKVQKLEEYNDKMESIGKKEEILPRILLLIDEFQVMFTEVDQKSTDKIKEKIVSLSKLARFCGCHMWFTSQSMSNTLPKDILDQFRLRIALNCSSDTSSSLIGDPAASKLPPKGYVITNETAGEDPTKHTKWRVPFIPNKEVNRYVPLLIEKCREGNHIHRQASFYDEEELHPGTELKQLYDTNSDLRNEQGLIILGQRTGFSLNRAPANIILKRDDGENIIVSAFEREALLGLSNTIIENIKSRENTSLVVHCADRDSYNLLGLEERLPANVLPIANPSFDYMRVLELLENNISAREANPELIDKELYFVGINYEKTEGLGRNQVYKLGDRFKAILQKAPTLNIHVVLIVREAKEFRPQLGTFNHRIMAYTSEADSSMLHDSVKGNKLNKITAIHKYGSEELKFKIYQFPIYGELGKREVVL